jgi:acyl dehydratase
MPLDTSLAGTKIGPVVNEIDARWTMAYAAAVGDNLPCYMDTRRSDGVVAHPVFPVCFEWTAAHAIRAKCRANLSQIEAARGVHVTQHMILHRPVRPPERLATTASLVGIERRKAGAYEVVEYTTVDDKGAPVCTTYSGNIYRQVEVKGRACPAETPKMPLPAALSETARAEFKIPVPAGAAHVYTECARIWNPIHTDAAVAANAGLPAIILHGTATLALAVSRVIETEALNDPARVTQIYARFGAVVLMPSEMTLRVCSREKHVGGDAVFFEVISVEGGPAIRDGVVMLRQ